MADKVAKKSNSFLAHNVDPRLLGCDGSPTVETSKNAKIFLPGERDIVVVEGSSALIQASPTRIIQQHPPLLQPRESYTQNSSLQVTLETYLQESKATSYVPAYPAISRSEHGTHPHRDNYLNPGPPSTSSEVGARVNQGMTTLAPFPDSPSSHTLEYVEQPNNGYLISTAWFPVRNDDNNELSTCMAPSPQSPSPIVTSTTFPCGWNGCSEIFDDLMLLRHHVTETHVGRATRVLNLQCRWNGCDRVFKKRDNITSHLHTHIPYFEHVCDYCGRKWQRRHDLTKHLKGRHAPIIKDGLKHWPIKLFNGLNNDRKLAVTPIGSFPLSEPLPDLQRGHFHYITTENMDISSAHQGSATQSRSDQPPTVASWTIERSLTGLQSPAYFEQRYARLSKDCTPRGETPNVALAPEPNSIIPTATTTSQECDEKKVALTLQTSQTRSPAAGGLKTREPSLIVAHLSQATVEPGSVGSRRRAPSSDANHGSKRHCPEVFKDKPEIPGSRNSPNGSPKSSLTSDLPYNLGSLIQMDVLGIGSNSNLTNQSIDDSNRGEEGSRGVSN